MKNIIKILPVLLIMWPVYAQSQEPPPRPLENIQVHNTKTKEINNKSNTDQQTTATSLVIVKALPTTPRDIQPKEKTENTFKESFYDKLIGWSTVIIAVVTAILAYFTYKLWASTKDTAKRQLRAYVFVSLADGEKLFFDNKNECLSAPLIIRNYGQTPAYKLKCSVFIGLYKLPLSEVLDPPDYTNGSLGLVAPTQVFRQYPTLPRILNQSEMNAIKTGEGGIYVWGYLEYVDIFNKTQTTEFRMYSTGPDFDRGELAYCEEGNKAT